MSVIAATSGCGESTQQEIDDISATTGPDDQSVVDEPSTVISPEHQYQGEDEF